MTEKRLSELLKVFQAFFRALLATFGVNSPDKLTKEAKMSFFKLLKREWAALTLEKKIQLIAELAKNKANAMLSELLGPVTFTEPESEPELELISPVEPEPVAEPKTKPEPDNIAKAEPQSAPAPKVEPAAETDSNSEPEPKPEEEPESEVINENEPPVTHSDLTTTTISAPNTPSQFPKRQKSHWRSTITSPQNGVDNRGLVDIVIKSEANPEQTDDLRIKYAPNDLFTQTDEYLYPVVKMPQKGAYLKLPRQGRTNQKGYKERDFYNAIQKQLPEIACTDDVHLVVPHFSKPYEPDIVLYDQKLQLYIDIEIDEPYDGYFRHPTHHRLPEGGEKKDDLRDLFFNESGWIVLRFTEKQVHQQQDQCINFIKTVMNSIYQNQIDNRVLLEQEGQWDIHQCISWQKDRYREKYLGIEGFKKTPVLKEIFIEPQLVEGIEKAIQRTAKKHHPEPGNSSIDFDEQTHKYIAKEDLTGNAEYISVTTLIERFFPFDLKRYLERKAQKENKSEEEVLDEYLTVRDEAADKGTDLHKQIETYLKENMVAPDFDANSIEFQYFLDFYDTEVKKRKLDFYDAERMITSEIYSVAGTIDCLFKKKDKDEYVMLDWKRSKKLIIDGYPRIYGFGYALSELNHLDNSSYYKYCLQQNIYKYIIENEIDIKISSMRLVVLHENYDKYYVIKVPEMKKEALIILNSLKHKI